MFLSWYVLCTYMYIFHGISIFIISSFSPLHRYFVHLSPVSYGDFHGEKRWSSASNWVPWEENYFWIPIPLPIPIAFALDPRQKLALVYFRQFLGKREGGYEYSKQCGLSQRSIPSIDDHGIGKNLFDRCLGLQLSLYSCWWHLICSRSKIAHFQKVAPL